jgi:hypothetical protein
MIASAIATAYSPPSAKRPPSKQAHPGPILSRRCQRPVLRPKPDPLLRSALADRRASADAGAVSDVAARRRDVSAYLAAVHGALYRLLDRMRTFPRTRIAIDILRLRHSQIWEYRGCVGRRSFYL